MHYVIVFTRSSHFNKYLHKPSLMRVDSGAYPRGGKLTLEASLRLSLFSYAL
jgi:hypothetical protein